MIWLSAFFIGGLVVANVVGARIILICGVPLSAGAVSYPVTFLCTDIVSEVYGKKAAARMVWAGFLASVFASALVYLCGWFPESALSSVGSAYYAVLGASWRVTLASMLAYLTSQHMDVHLFHWWRKLTNGKHLWLRNNGSTMISQFVDSAIFVVVAFGGLMSLAALWSVVVGQYLVKAGIALLDTPFCYLGVWLFRRPPGGCGGNCACRGG